MYISNNIRVYKALKMFNIYCILSLTVQTVYLRLFSVLFMKLFGIVFYFAQ